MARIRRRSTGPRPPAESMASTADRVMADHADRLRDAINDPWPERTGRSRWFVIKLDEAEYSIGSSARYASFVRLKGERSPFVQTHAPAIAAGVEAETSTLFARELAQHITLER